MEKIVSRRRLNSVEIGSRTYTLFRETIKWKEIYRYEFTPEEVCVEREGPQLWKGRSTYVLAFNKKQAIRRMKQIIYGEL